MEKQNLGSVLVAIVSGTKIPLTRQPMKARPGKPLYWKLFGGKIEVGETHNQAAIREVKEEGGIDLNGFELRKLSEHQQVGPSGPYVQYLFAVGVPYYTIKEHDGHLVELFDDEDQKLESTCFELSELEHMVDLMPKHREFIRQLVAR